MALGRDMVQTLLGESDADHHRVAAQRLQQPIVIAAAVPQAVVGVVERDEGHRHRIDVLRRHGGERRKAGIVCRDGPGGIREKRRFAGVERRPIDLQKDHVRTGAVVLRGLLCGSLWTRRGFCCAHHAGKADATAAVECLVHEYVQVGLASHRAIRSHHGAGPQRALAARGEPAAQRLAATGSFVGGNGVATSERAGAGERLVASGSGSCQVKSGHAP